VSEIHLPIRIVVIKNNSFAQIKWEQMVFLGNPDMFAICSLSILRESPERSNSKFCDRGPARCGSTLDQALAWKGRF